MATLGVPATVTVPMVLEPLGSAGRDVTPTVPMALDPAGSAGSVDTATEGVPEMATLGVPATVTVPMVLEPAGSAGSATTPTLPIVFVPAGRGGCAVEEPPTWLCAGGMNATMPAVTSAALNIVRIGRVPTSQRRAGISPVANDMPRRHAPARLQEACIQVLRYCLVR